VARESAIKHNIALPATLPSGLKYAIFTIILTDVVIGNCPDAVVDIRFSVVFAHSRTPGVVRGMLEKV